MEIVIEDIRNVEIIVGEKFNILIVEFVWGKL